MNYLRSLRPPPPPEIKTGSFISSNFDSEILEESNEEESHADIS